ncbi:MAG: glutathione S-transferase family protein [Kiloniellales bacterium]
MLRLLGRKTSGNVQKVVWLLEELGLAYEREDYGRQFGNTEDEAYLALNPNAKVPTLVDGGTIVWESNTILRYLCAKAGSDLLPADPAARSQAERWMDWQLASINPLYMGIFRESKKPADERRPDLQADGDALAEQLAILDGQMAGRDWVAGDAMTVADVCLGPIVHRCLGFPVELPAFGNVGRWHDRILSRDAFRKAVEG